jgi:hypothetical protein
MSVSVDTGRASHARGQPRTAKAILSNRVEPAFQPNGSRPLSGRRRGLVWRSPWLLRPTRDGFAALSVPRSKPTRVCRTVQRRRSGERPIIFQGNGCHPSESEWIRCLQFYNRLSGCWLPRCQIDKLDAGESDRIDAAVIPRSCWPPNCSEP